MAAPSSRGAGELQGRETAATSGVGALVAEKLVAVVACGSTDRGGQNGFGQRRLQEAQ